MCTTIRCSFVYPLHVEYCVARVSRLRRLAASYFLVAKKKVVHQAYVFWMVSKALDLSAVNSVHKHGYAEGL